MVKLEHETRQFRWRLAFGHDLPRRPPMGSMLLALEVPPRAATRCSPTSTRAYETLSARMREVLDGLVAVNSSAKADVIANTRRSDPKTDGERTRGS